MSYEQRKVWGEIRYSHVSAEEMVRGLEGVTEKHKDWIPKDEILEVLEWIVVELNKRKKERNDRANGSSDDASNTSPSSSSPPVEGLLGRVGVSRDTEGEGQARPGKERLLSRKGLSRVDSKERTLPPDSCE